MASVCSDWWEVDIFKNVFSTIKYCNILGLLIAVLMIAIKFKTNENIILVNQVL